VVSLPIYSLSVICPCCQDRNLTHLLWADSYPSLHTQPLAHTFHRHPITSHTSIRLNFLEKFLDLLGFSWIWDFAHMIFSTWNFCCPYSAGLTPKLFSRSQLNCYFFRKIFSTVLFPLSPVPPKKCLLDLYGSEKVLLMLPSYCWPGCLSFRLDWAPQGQESNLFRTPEDTQCSAQSLATRWVNKYFSNKSKKGKSKWFYSS
jgi:hypothetical protein